MHIKDNLREKREKPSTIWHQIDKILFIVDEEMQGGKVKARKVSDLKKHFEQFNYKEEIIPNL